MPPICKFLRRHLDNWTMQLSSVIEMQSVAGFLDIMNYRHAYHAGNFADILKHIVLARCVAHLREKSAPFRVIDTHAGIGIYDLKSSEALRTSESQLGITKIEAAAWPDEIAALLRPFRDAIETTRIHDGASSYPGSPAIVRSLLRAEDRLIANELHPEDYKTLREAFSFEIHRNLSQEDGG